MIWTSRLELKSWFFLFFGFTDLRRTLSLLYVRQLFMLLISLIFRTSLLVTLRSLKRGFELLRALHGSRAFNTMQFTVNIYCV